MNVTKKFFACLVIAGLSLPVLAQKVTVSKEKERIKGNHLEGYATELNGTLEEVNASFIKYLKTVGKVKAFSVLPTQVTDANVNGVRYAAPIHAMTRAKGEKVLAWIGLDNAADSSQASSARKDFEKVVYDFGVRFYQDQIQKDIDESERAQQTAEKKTQQLQNENKSLNSRLEFNQKEKLRLEKALADNKLEYETLLLNIASNIKGQDSVSVATEQIKKMVDLHKERQKKVN